MKIYYCLDRLTLMRWVSVALLLMQRGPAIANWMAKARVLKPGYVQFAKWFAPIASTFGTMHAASGVSPEVVPAGISENPATAAVGEEFVWVFQTTAHRARSYDVQGLPPGMNYPGTVQSGVSFITGTPTEAGQYSIEITGYRGTNLTRDQTPTFMLELTISNNDAAISDFDRWRSMHWQADDLEDAGVSGPDADPDRDGWTNTFEYGFGQNPNVKNARVSFRSSVVRNDQGTFLRLEMPTVTVTDLDLRVDLSETLESSDWTDVTDDVVIMNEETSGIQILQIPIETRSAFARVRLEFTNESS